MTTLPERIGKYYVLERHGRTPLWESFKVKTVGIAGFEKVQALKRYSVELSLDPGFMRAFADRTRRAVALNHRAAVPVFDFGSVDDALFVATEFVHGMELRAVLAAARAGGGSLPVGLSCQILSELASVLDHAHRRELSGGPPTGIVHGDVRTAGVVISHDGFVKLGDFGAALAVAEATTFAASRPPVPRARHRAPELSDGADATPAADVFALALVAWEVLTGLPLHDGADATSLVDELARNGPPNLARLCAEVPTAVTDLVRAALALAPERRPAAAELANVFETVARKHAEAASSRAVAAKMASLFPSASFADTIDDEPPTSPEGSAHTLNETAPLGEQRRVVFVACRLGEGHADREAPSETFRRDRRLVADLAYKHGAVVEAEGVEWLHATFGVEFAGEDDLLQASRFALDAIEALREASATATPLRIGMQSGIIARATDDGATAPHGLRALGDARATTRALANAARAGRPLFGGQPGRHAAAHFEFRVREEPVDLRGRSLSTRELVGPRTVPAGPISTLPDVGPFIGRDDDLLALQAAWNQARHANARIVVCVVGAAGIGKTRLVAEFSSAIAHDQPVCVRVAAMPGDDDNPCAVIAAIFHAAVGLPPSRGAAARALLRSRLGRMLAAAELPQRELDGTLAAVELATALRDGLAPEREPQPEQLRAQLITAVGAVRSLAPAGRPRLTVLEDLQWADGTSRGLLGGLLDAEAPGAELVIVTVRPGPDGELPDLGARIATVIRLNELRAEDRRALARVRLGPDCADDAVALVEQRGGGNPLFIEELALAVTQRGAGGGGGLPDGLRGVVMARVEQLPRNAKAVLQHAAVLGSRFSAVILEAIVGRSVVRALTLLEERDLVVRVPEAASAVGVIAEHANSHAFRHGLLQEYVYESLSAAARGRAHREVGLVLADRYEAGRGESPAMIARHLELGGERARAAGYHLRGGRIALAASDSRRAEQGFTRALAHEEHLDPEAVREATSGRAEARFHLGEHEGQREDLDRLELLCTHSPPDLAAALNRQASRLMRLGEYGAAATMTERAERAAQAGGADRALGEAWLIRGEAFERISDFDRALHAVTHALEIFRRIDAAPEETRALVGLGRIHLLASRYEAALTYYLPALERAERTQDSWAERLVCNNVAVLHLCLSNYPRAMAHARRAHEICRRLADRPREGDNASVIGNVFLLVGRLDEAREWSRQGLEIHAQTGSRWSRADALVYGGATELLLGESEVALAMLNESIALADEIGARYVKANALNQRALVWLGRGTPRDLAAAERDASSAAECGRDAALHGCVIQGLSRTALARLRAGAPEQALAPSSEAIARLDELGHIEWSEEEIHLTHSRVLRALGDPSADDSLQRAHYGLNQKLQRLDRPEWRESFASLALHCEIRDEFVLTRTTE